MMATVAATTKVPTDAGNSQVIFESLPTDNRVKGFVIWEFEKISD